MRCARRRLFSGLDLGIRGNIGDTARQSRERLAPRIRLEADVNPSLPTNLKFPATVAQPVVPICRATGCPGRSHSASFDHRRRPEMLRDNPTYLARRERIYDGMRQAGVPEE